MIYPRRVQIYLFSRPAIGIDKSYVHVYYLLTYTDLVARGKVLPSLQWSLVRTT
eukprot:COSAG01_NODE_4383_length_5080_cov_2.620558_2_plen_54_part_00